MKKNEDTLEKDSKTWHWCPKHVVPGEYDGLYVTHKPEHHDDWKKRREAWRVRRSDTKKQQESGQNDSDQKKLVLMDTLKAA